jgi:hypothetical protein
LGHIYILPLILAHDDLSVKSIKLKEAWKKNRAEAELRKDVLFFFSFDIPYVTHCGVSEFRVPALIPQFFGPALGIWIVILRVP